MSMMKTRTREITGPYPGSFAVLARPAQSRDLEALFRMRNEVEASKRNVEERARLQRKEDLRSEWEENSNRKISAKNLVRKVEEMRRVDDLDLEKRRQRLREQLRAEENAFLAEVDASRETSIERQAKMRARARELREGRERERVEEATARYEQQFRENCDELRQDQQMRHLQSVARERAAQIWEKEKRKETNAREEEVWARLWEQDKMSKDQKADEEAMKKALANRERLSVLSQQMDALQAQKKEEKRIKEEEAKILQEQEGLRRLEALQERFFALRNSERYRRDLRRGRRMALKAELTRQREEMALDLEMLARLDSEIKDEAAKEKNEKRRMRDELERYMNYLAQEKAAKEEEEKRIEALADAEVEAAWKRREAQWAREREARSRLLREVIASWDEQIRVHVLANQEAEASLAAERREFAALIQNQKREDEERAAQLDARTKTYAGDLLQQIDYNKKVAYEKREEETKMNEEGIKEENEYRRKVQFVLENPDPRRMHPVKIRSMPFEPVAN